MKSDQLHKHLPSIITPEPCETLSQSCCSDTAGIYLRIKRSKTHFLHLLYQTHIIRLEVSLEIRVCEPNSVFGCNATIRRVMTKKRQKTDFQASLKSVLS